MAILIAGPVMLHLSTACAFTAVRPDSSSAAGDTSRQQRTSSCGFSVAWHKTVDASAFNDDSTKTQRGAHKGAHGETQRHTQREATSPPGNLDWVQRAPGLFEVTVGATGLRQGSKLVNHSSEAGPVMESMQSSLCKRQMLHSFEETLRIALFRSTATSGRFDAQQCENNTDQKEAWAGISLASHSLSPLFFCLPGSLTLDSSLGLCPALSSCATDVC